MQQARSRYPPTSEYFDHIDCNRADVNITRDLDQVRLAQTNIWSERWISCLRKRSTPITHMEHLTLGNEVNMVTTQSNYVVESKFYTLSYQFMCPETSDYTHRL